ncbi:MAG: hypothetical protein AAF732_06460 [Pseudomonadota bacterium]
MLYVDLPTRPEFLALNACRADACVSLYVETTPLTQHADASRTKLSNLFKSAAGQLETDGFHKKRLLALAHNIESLLSDDAFWRVQANSLAVLATPDNIQTFRLANRLPAMAQVSDRFHLSPLLRAITFPQSAYVLALSENAVRLVEVGPDLPPSTVHVAALPRDAASAIGKSTLNDRGPSGRIQGAEGQNVRLRQYARHIDSALRPILSGRDTPLILATADRMASIYRSVNSYPNLATDTISSTNDHTSDVDLADAARHVIDALNAREVTEFKSLFETRASANRATSDLSNAARAATIGSIDTLLVDMDSSMPGVVDELTGAITFAETASASTYDIVDEIAARAFASGARVLAVRKADLPDNTELAAILRYVA